MVLQKNKVVSEYIEILLKKMTIKSLNFVSEILLLCQFTILLTG